MTEPFPDYKEHKKIHDRLYKNLFQDVYYGIPVPFMGLEGKLVFWHLCIPHGSNISKEGSCINCKTYIAPYRKLGVMVGLKGLTE